MWYLKLNQGWPHARPSTLSPTNSLAPLFLFWGTTPSSSRGGKETACISRYWTRASTYRQDPKAAQYGNYSTAHYTPQSELAGFSWTSRLKDEKFPSSFQLSCQPADPKAAGSQWRLMPRETTHKGNTQSRRVLAPHVQKCTPDKCINVHHLAGLQEAVIEEGSSSKRA